MLRKSGLEGAEDTRREEGTGISLFWVPAFGNGFCWGSATSPGCARAPPGYEVLGFLPRCLLVVRNIPASHRESAPPGSSQDAAKE